MDSRYKNGKIYKLVCDATPIVYYGSTIKTLSLRLSHHKSHKTCCSRELFELGNVSIELVEEYPCNNKYELQSRERFYIEFMLNNFTHRVICNERIPTRTKQEYNQDNRDSINEKCRKYHQNNKEYRNENRRKYYLDNKDATDKKRNEKFNCECGGRYTRSGKSQHFKTNIHKEYINALGK